MRVKKWLKRLAVTLVVLIAVVAAAGWIVTTYYQDELKAYALEQLDVQLVTNMQVSQLDFTLWDKFPHASLRFEDVVIEETFERKDTLLAAETLYLEFNIWDLVGGNYTLESIDIRSALVQLERDGSGADNYHFWKTDSSTTDPVALQLDHITLSDSRFKYADVKHEVRIDVQVDEGTFEGAFAEEVFTLQSNADAYVTNLQVGTTRYIADKSLDADVALDLDLSTGKYRFEDGAFVIGGVPLAASGLVHVQETTTELDLTVSSRTADVSQAVANVPDTWQGTLAAYQPDGLLSFDGTIKGRADATHQPTVSLNYAVSNARFVHNASAVSLSDMDASGTFVYGPDAPAQLVVHNLSADFEDGTIQARGSMTGLQNPTLNLDLSGDFELNDLRKFAELQELDVLEGRFKLEADFTGVLGTDGAFTRADLNGLKATGTATFGDAAVQMAGSPLLFDGLQGTFRLDGLDVSVESLKGALEQSDFALTGRFNNLLPYLLFDGEVLDIQAAMDSQTLDFDELLTPGSSAASEDYHLAFPPNLSFAMDVEVEQLRFRKFEARSLNGRARLRDRQLRLDPLAFATSEGRFTTTATLDGRSPEALTLYSQSRIEDMDVRQLFVSFENFGQDFITAQHLKGRATANADFRATLGSDLSFDPDKIRSSVDIELRNGELIGLKSMLHIADYIDQNLLISQFVNENALRDKLEHIAFATLRNTLTIHDGVIEIPDMDIQSSAMDITVAGSHAFDNRIDYSLGFQVRDVLCKNNNSEFGSVEDDGLSHRFYLSMQGTSDDPAFAYDRLAHKAQRKENRQAEKEVFRDVLRSGLTGEPVTAVPDEPSPQVAVSVEWGEDQETQPDPDKPLSWKERLKKKKQEGSKVPLPPDDDDDEDF